MDIDHDDEILVNITTRSSKYHVVFRKTLVIFLTVSVLSILLYLYTGLSYLQSYAYYFSTFFFPLLTQVLQRKYMFLLCNGILVFLAVLSGFWGASSNNQQELSRGDMKITEDDSPFDRVSFSSMIREHGKKKLEQEEEEEVEEKLDEEDREDWIDDGGPLEEVAEEKLDEEDREDWIDDGGPLEEEDEEEMVNVSMVTGEESEGNAEMESEDPASINAEELNRKIEEFIRKMKDELRLEAQQHHLIAV